MRNDERFEIQRAFDLLPHIVGCSWASIWFRMNGIKKPTRDPVFDCYPKEEKFQAIQKYIDFRIKDEIQKVTEGLNPEVEKRYDRYVDYG
jgi:hypothetical protein